MRMKAIAVLAAAVPFALPASLRAQASIEVYVSLGDSLAAGFSNGALVESHQRVSVPALIARQARVDGFEQPLVGEPGIPAELALVGWYEQLVHRVEAYTANRGQRWRDRQPVTGRGALPGR